MKRKTGISIIVIAVLLDEEIEKMTDDCLYAFADTMEDGDELIFIDDTKELSGTAASWNRGIKKAKNDIILISNNDIDPQNWRDPMIKALDKYDIVFPVIFNEKINKEVRHLAGEFWMFHKKLIDKIGLINEEYGSYFEDTDFFMRTIESGGKLGIAEGTYVIHQSQATFKKFWNEDTRKANFNKNKAIYEARFDKYPYLSS